jgi:hypothetical protein
MRTTALTAGAACGNKQCLSKNGVVGTSLSGSSCKVKRLRPFVSESEFGTKARDLEVASLRRKTFAASGAYLDYTGRNPAFHHSRHPPILTICRAAAAAPVHAGGVQRSS